MTLTRSRLLKLPQLKADLSRNRAAVGADKRSLAEAEQARVAAATPAVPSPAALTAKAASRKRKGSRKADVRGSESHVVRPDRVDESRVPQDEASQITGEHGRRTEEEQVAESMAQGPIADGIVAGALEVGRPISKMAVEEWDKTARTSRTSAKRGREAQQEELEAGEADGTVLEECTPAPIVLLRGKKARTVGPAAPLSSVLQTWTAPSEECSTNKKQLGSPELIKADSLEAVPSEPGRVVAYGRAQGDAPKDAALLRRPPSSSNHIESLILTYTQVPALGRDIWGQQWHGSLPPWLPSRGASVTREMSRQASFREDVPVGAEWEVGEANEPPLVRGHSGPATYRTGREDQVTKTEQAEVKTELGGGLIDQVDGWLLDGPVLNLESLEWPSLDADSSKSEGVKSSIGNSPAACTESAGNLDGLPPFTAGARQYRERSMASWGDQCEVPPREQPECSNEGAGAEVADNTEESCSGPGVLDEELWGGISGDLFGGRVDEVLSLGCTV